MSGLDAALGLSVVGAVVFVFGCAIREMSPKNGRRTGMIAQIIGILFALPLIARLLIAAIIN